MSDGEDWFERALQETENADSTGDDADSTSGTDDGDSRPAGTGEGPDWAGNGQSEHSDASGRAGEQSATEFGPSGGDAEPPNADGFGDASSPFEEDFASALQNAPDPESMGFGGNGGGGTGGGDGGFEDPAAGAFGGGQSQFSGKSFESRFDEAEFDSDIERIQIGIDGLDEMILGGVPQRSLMVAIGSAGTGKTTFGLQFLQRALADDQSAVFITLEESRERVLDTAAEKGWEFRDYVDEGRLAVIDLDPIEMANSLSSIRNDLPRLIEGFGADRLVLDSVSLLEMMYDHPSRRRSEVFEFTRALKEAGVTTMLTSEANEDNPYSSRHGLVEYLADAVFILQYVRPDDFRETRLAIEIQKIRDANHSRETKPYEITGEGISVYRQANIF